MYTFCQGPGPLYLRAFALRGTMYTLISNIDEAIQDLTQVIDAESLEDLTKVLLQLPCVNLLAFCQESFTPNCQSPSFKYPVFWNHKIFGEQPDLQKSCKFRSLSRPQQNVWIPNLNHLALYLNFKMSTTQQTAYIYIFILLVL